MPAEFPKVLKGATILKKNGKSYVSPIYAVAMIWIGWTLVLPLFSIMHYIPLIAVSVAVYNIVNAVIKKNDADDEKAKARQRRKNRAAEKTKTETPKEEKGTGNPRVDALIKQRDDAISEMRRLNMNIENEKITAQINDMEYTTSKIFEYVIQNPDKVSSISKFFDYYLPTTIKLLDTYDKMNSRGVKGENISSTMAKVEETLNMVTEAFHKTLDTLFAGEAIDVSADISVMENLMKNEGLTGDSQPGEINLTTSE